MTAVESTGVMCARCDDGTTPATTFQTYRASGALRERETYRCDRCALALREYVALPNISTTITRDEPLT